MQNTVKTILLQAREQILKARKEALRVALLNTVAPYDKQLAEIDAVLNAPDDEFIKLLPITKSIKPKQPTNRGRKTTPVLNSILYPTGGTVLSKVIYVVKSVGRFVTIGEIAYVAKSYEPSLTIEDIKEKFGKHIKKYVRNGFLASYTVRTRRNTLYGVPEWYKNGVVAPGREHDSDVLIDPVKNYVNDSNTPLAKNGLSDSKVDKDEEMVDIFKT